jgi:hypothetical protein
MKKQIAFPLVIWLFFMTIAVSLGLTIHLFYLFNFTYIGTCVAGGIFLKTGKFKHARLSVIFRWFIYVWLSWNTIK